MHAGILFTCKHVTYVHAYRGWQNYLAYASQSTVVVLDPQSMQVLQTLTHGTSLVTKVCMYVRTYLGFILQESSQAAW